MPQTSEDEHCLNDSKLHARVSCGSKMGTANPNFRVDNLLSLPCKSALPTCLTPVRQCRCSEANKDVARAAVKGRGKQRRRGTEAAASQKRAQWRPEASSAGYSAGTYPLLHPFALPQQACSPFHLSCTGLPDVALMQERHVHRRGETWGQS